MMPLWWLAPFFDHTSFGKEAATIILGLVRSDGRETSDQVMLETTQGECNYSLDESMPYPDYLELDQAVKRGREHLLQWNKRHDVNATKNEGEAKVKYAKMIASASEAGRQPMKQFQMITDAIRSSMESQLGGKFAKIEVKAEPPPASSSDSEGPLRIRDRTYYSDEERSEGAIVVCHSLPPFWARPLHQWRTCAPCPPIGYIPAYAIGRAMAETDVYNSEFVRSCNTMDEIWVPSKFSLDTLRTSGVTVPIRIVPIAVNTTMFDPSAIKELKHLPIGELVMGQHRRLKPSAVTKSDKDEIRQKVEYLTNRVTEIEASIRNAQVATDLEAMLKENLVISKPGGGTLSREEVAVVVAKTIKRTIAMHGHSDKQVNQVEVDGWKESLAKAREELVVAMNERDRLDESLEAELSPGMARPTALLRIVKTLKGNGPVVKLPWSSEKEQRQEDPSPPHRRRLKPFCFISTFKWEERKGWKTLLSAYLQEFSSQDDVELYILTKPFSNIDTSFEATVHSYAQRQLNIQVKKEQKWWEESESKPQSTWSFWSVSDSAANEKTSSSSPALYIISHHLSSEEYAQMYKSCQAYVSPSRGEGWGMPVTEAMSMGLPVLVTNWSGLVDFVDESVGRLLNYSLTPIPRSTAIPWWFWDARWAEVDVADLRKAMREAFEQPELTRLKGQAARKRMETLYSPAAVARIVASEVARIRAGIRSGEIEGYRKDHVLAPDNSTSVLSAIYTGQEPFSIPTEGSKDLWSCQVCILIIWAVVALDLTLMTVVFVFLVRPWMTGKRRAEGRKALVKGYKDSTWTTTVQVCP